MDDRARLVAQLQGQPTAPHAFARAPVPSLDDRAYKLLGADPTLAYRGTVLPVGRTAEGGLTMAWPQFVVDMARSAALPRHAAEGGEFSVNDVTRMGMDVGMLGSVAPAPAGAVRMFGGVNARTANREALQQAQDMAARGASRDEIWSATGWFTGPDGKWRFEIDDSAATIKGVGTIEEVAARRGDKMGDVLFHSEAFDAYPVMQDLRLEFQPGRGGAFAEGYGVPGHVRLGNQLDDASTPLHEMQHYVQRREGFETGGNPAAMFDETTPQLETLRKMMEDAYAKGDMAAVDRIRQEMNRMTVSAPDPHEAYRRLAGEAEARNVQARMNMTPEQRRATPPWQTLDVPEDQLIVRGRDGQTLAANTATPLQRLYAMMQSHDNATRDRVARETLAKGGT